MVYHIVFQCCEDGLEINTEMLIETFVLSVNQCTPEHGVHLFVTDGCAVFTEVFTNQHIVGTV